jgi:hypothetical protein
MIAETKKKYKNITQEIILMYFKYCEPCQMKQKCKKKGLVTKPTFQSMVKSQRDLSIKALTHQAEKMKFRSINKFPPASIGDTVRVTVPDVDRGRGDLRNILFALISIKDGE